MTEQQQAELYLEMYVFESEQLIGQLEAILLECEKSGSFASEAVDEIFRSMHTLKGSAAMMQFACISEVAHAIEDLFYALRLNPLDSDSFGQLFELILTGLDFIKAETLKLRQGHEPDGNAESIVAGIKSFLDYWNKAETEREYMAVVFFDEGCQMENVRAYNLLRQLADRGLEPLFYEPVGILEGEDTVDIIRNEGFKLNLCSASPEEDIRDCLHSIAFVREVQLRPVSHLQSDSQVTAVADEDFKETASQYERRDIPAQTLISVNVGKLDQLMDLVGELVIAEAMVTQHEELKDIASDHFQKAAVHLRKITGELQNIVMSIRMVPLATTFHKMHRIVRDMGKKLDKEVDIHIIGEETEVDKNIIEHIADPLMHLVRNAVDHGMENTQERLAAGKTAIGSLTLEARNAGSDVIILVRDDGRGLDKDKIFNRAVAHGLIIGREQTDMSDREIFNLIFLPGFSTKENVTEYSGRGVGMDVAFKNIENVGGSIAIESVKGEGTVISLKIPLTLAIIDGMNVRVGNSRYTIPTTAIQESFKPRLTDTLVDPVGNEMIMLRGECYPILRLHEQFGKGERGGNLNDGVLVVVEQEERRLCLLVDELLGQQQVVVKTLPAYIRNLKKINGLAGCTLLGDGSISLILDVAGLMDTNGAAKGRLHQGILKRE
ncbi:chemotaxis protein CheW [Paenibacillus sp. GCM10012307]|uniref:Chemotaxis protein CheA n=1 Tax=Paenibacillus roseus TaxID=2798579 RepID=A0A934IVY9_9BACL|nr:chemotaxis protein CheA [Paenibacillus roseus]MBJ6360302.1 chemotaxis protein CheA [Paenibacillus roseus]